jgi:hypothetical protein
LHAIMACINLKSPTHGRVRRGGKLSEQGLAPALNREIPVPDLSRTFFCLCEEQAAPKSAAQRHYRPEQKQ